MFSMQGEIRLAARVLFSGMQGEGEGDTEGGGGGVGAAGAGVWACCGDNMEVGDV